jgi:hypothetical protein
MVASPIPNTNFTSSDAFINRRVTGRNIAIIESDCKVFLLNGSLLPANALSTE